jgi:hypothetical protein
MLWTIIIILLVLWFLGFVVGIGAAAVGNFVHILLVAAVVVFLIQYAKNRGGGSHTGLGL